MCVDIFMVADTPLDISEQFFSSLLAFYRDDFEHRLTPISNDQFLTADFELAEDLKHVGFENAF